MGNGQLHIESHTVPIEVTVVASAIGVSQTDRFVNERFIKHLQKLQKIQLWIEISSNNINTPVVILARSNVINPTSTATIARAM